MINTALLDSLSLSDKQELMNSLETLINQTYAVEKEYHTLQTLLTQIVEYMPTALWVYDEEGELFLQNSHAQNLNINALQKFQKNHEWETHGRFFLAEQVTIAGKTIIQATDITEQKRTERLVAMGQMAAHLAHEIRNPIGSVSILLSLLSNKADDKQKSIIEEMKKGIWRVERIIRATLLFSKDLTINCTTMTLHSLEEQLLEALTFYSYTKEIVFESSIEQDLFYGDTELMGIVFQNLLFNAIDAIEESDDESGNIRLQSHLEDTMIVIGLYDSGAHVKNPELLFEAFKTTKTKGNGLGLALSNRIVLAHGGSLRYCESPKGFEVLLPYYKEDKC